MRNGRWPLILAGLWLLSGFYSLRPDEQGVVRLFGRVVEEYVPPGLHWRWPWPCTRLDRVKVRERKRVVVGFDPADRITGRQPSPLLSQFLTGDQNLIHIEMSVYFTVREPAKYLFRARDITTLVQMAAEQALTQAVAGSPVDDVLTEGRLRLQAEVLQHAQELLNQHDVGVQLASVNLQNVYPPSEVREAFASVVNAREDRQRLINEAQAYANEVIPKARGEAERILREAEAYRDEAVQRARGDAQRFLSLYEEYRKAKDLTTTRLYLEAMETLLPRLRKVMVDTGRGQPVELGVVKSPSAVVQR